LKILKRDGSVEEFNFDKIRTAVTKAYNSCGKEVNETVLSLIHSELKIDKYYVEPVSVETIQDVVERIIGRYDFDVAKDYILYREKHKQARLIEERMAYMDKYRDSGTNAATASETDSNANVGEKNVANLEGEVYKTTNRIIQRKRMKKQLKKDAPEVADMYEPDIESHIIYICDEASSPVPKFYCQAASMYPLMTEGVGNIDGVTPTPPNDIQSFSGQATNLVFLLSSQCKGAVALGEYFIALNYYVVAEFGDKWYDHLNDTISNGVWNKDMTVKKYIRKGMKQFIFGVNQPAGNRCYNSPFSNLSYYDSTYYESLFGDFYYPDGTKPEWKAVDTLQRIFMELHRELRLMEPLTFPVTTMAMVHDGHDVIDKEYKKLCAEEWAKGGSFFCYLSDSPTSLASCCRVLNEIDDNTFSSTTGLQGIMTGSCNVITLNLNRIIQNFYKDNPEIEKNVNAFKESFDSYFCEILERVYKYHKAYKTILYDWEDKGMFASSNSGYIYMKKLYSTLGLIGYCEAAQFMNLEVSNNDEYKDFIGYIFGIVKRENKKHTVRSGKYPIMFNSEAVPGETMAVRFYNWDKEDGYEVPENQNLYSCYFFLPWDDKISVLDKLSLHGRGIAEQCDGGQACHVNLESHLTEKQYEKIIDYCIKEGTNYFTFNIPMSKCLNPECKHVVNAPITKCPKCGGEHIDYYTRIIGYLRPVSDWGAARQKEFTQRKFNRKGIE
jgi:ribonucleoside-triphosphate reductase